MKFEEIAGALAAGLVAGLILAWVQRTFPTSGVTTL